MFLAWYTGKMETEKTMEGTGYILFLFFGKELWIWSRLSYKYKLELKLDDVKISEEENCFMAGSKQQLRNVVIKIQGEERHLDAQCGVVVKLGGQTSVLYSHHCPLQAVTELTL